MRQATRAQWIKCAIAIFSILFSSSGCVSWWGLIVIPFIFDIYITRKYPGRSGKGQRIRQFGVS